MSKNVGSNFGNVGRYVLQRLNTGPTFDNLQIKKLPIDNGPNIIRIVKNACFAYVKPTPLKHPNLLVYSPNALSLLDIDGPLDINGDDLALKYIDQFTQYFSGNQLWPDSKPYAHCYCGYQFGSFAGQLGDGAAMYVYLSF